MKLNLRIASLLLVIGIFGFSSIVSAQKTTANKAQPKAGTNSATPKKAKNINTGETVSPNTGNTRPASTGSGNGNGRPASTGETLSDIELLDRVEYGLFALRQDLNMYELNNWDNSGLNAKRATDFASAAYSKAKDLRNKYMELNGGWHDAPFYNINEGYEMKGVKNGLEILLNHLNNTEFESNGLKSDVKDKIQQAIAQVQAYLDNPPPPTKTAPNGAEAVKGKGNRKISDGKKAVNTNTIDTSLKTAPAGSTAPAKPTKTTNNKPNATSKTTKPANNLSGDDDLELQPQPKAKSKASSKTTKPTNNLDPLDDPWGKTPSKPKKKVNN